MASGSAFPHGVAVTGQLRGGKVEEGRERQDGTRWPDRFVLSILAGDDTYRIEYRDEAAARAAVPPDANPGDVVTVPVQVRAAKGYVFYVGQGAAPEADGDYSW